MNGPYTPARRYRLAWTLRELVVLAFVLATWFGLWVALP